MSKRVREKESETLMSVVYLIHQLVQKKLRKLKTNCPRKEELSFLLKRMVSSSTSRSDDFHPPALLPCCSVVTWLLKTNFLLSLQSRCSSRVDCTCVCTRV